MARVQPFRALRFASLNDVSRHLVPDAYAVRGPERTALTREDPLHVLRLYDAPDPWAALKRWEDQGVVVSEAPALYLVESKPAGAFVQTPPVRFLLGAMTAEEEELEELEQRPRRIATAPLEPVPVLAADDYGVLRRLFADVVRDSFPVWESDVEAQRIRMWRVGNTGLARRLRNALDEVPARPHGPVPERGPFLAAIVPLSEPGLRLLPYHRGIQNLPGFEPQRFLALVASYARIYDLDLPLTTRAGRSTARERLGTLSAGRHGFVLVLPKGEAKLLRFRQALELEHIPAAPRSPTLRSLDLALLNALVLRTVLGIADPEEEGSRKVHPVGSLRELVQKVDEGVFQAGFALNPPPMWELRAVIEAAQSLPPRTLRLSPLPPAGLLFLDPGARGAR